MGVGGGSGATYTNLAYHHLQKAQVLGGCLSVVQVGQAADGARPVSDVLLSDHHLKVLLEAVRADLALAEVQVANLTTTHKDASQIMSSNCVFILFRGKCGCHTRITNK